MSQHLLTRDQILTAKDLPTEDVPVPEWGGSVRVRTMTGAERDAFETSISEAGERRGKRNKTERRTNVRAALVAIVVVNEHGEQVFAKADIDKLGMKSAKALDRVAEVAMEMSGISSDDEEKLLEEDERDEDFGPTPGEPSTTE